MASAQRWAALRARRSSGGMQRGRRHHDAVGIGVQPVPVLEGDPGELQRVAALARMQALLGPARMRGKCPDAHRGGTQSLPCRARSRRRRCPASRCPRPGGPGSRRPARSAVTRRHRPPAPCLRRAPRERRAPARCPRKPSGSRRDRRMPRGRQNFGTPDPPRPPAGARRTDRRSECAPDVAARVVYDPNCPMVLCAPPAFSAASPAKYSLWSSPTSEPAMFWCFTQAMPWRISWRCTFST